MKLNEDEKAAIHKAKKTAYIDERKKIAARRARDAAQWDARSTLGKLFGWIVDLFKE
jgi:hypothetical protein